MNQDSQPGHINTDLKSRKRTKTSVTETGSNAWKGTATLQTVSPVVKKEDLDDDSPEAMSYTEDVLLSPKPEPESDGNDAEVVTDTNDDLPVSEPGQIDEPPGSNQGGESIIVDNQREMKESASLKQFELKKGKSKVTLYSCRLCGRILQSLQQISQHNHECPRQLSDVAMKSAQKNSDKQQHRLIVCEFCHQVIRQTDHAQHILELHKSYAWQCDFCDEQLFVNDQTKQGHIEQHLKKIEEKSEGEPLAQHSTAQKIDQHIKSETVEGDKSACAKCGGMFLNEVDRQAHQCNNDDDHSWEKQPGSSVEKQSRKDPSSAKTWNKLSPAESSVAKEKKKAPVVKNGKVAMATFSCGRCGAQVENFDFTKHLEKCLEKCHLCQFSAVFFKDVFQHASKDHQISIVKCRICYKIMNQSNFSQHLEKLHIGESWKCDFCTEKFFGTSRYKVDHIQRHLSKLASNKQQRRNFRCEQCHAKYSTPRSLESHLRLDHQYACSHCDMSFMGVHKLAEHLEWVTVNKVSGQHVCKQCAKMFVSDAHLALHKRKNHDYPCEKCSKSFTSERRCWAHQLAVHDRVQLFKTCTPCQKTFGNERDLRRHCRFTHDNCCVECMEFFPNAQIRQAHMTLAHPDYMDDNDDDYYNCAVCNQKWLNRQGFTQHWKTFHVTQCVHCGENFSTAEERVEHVYAAHRESWLLNQRRKFNYSCHKCGQGFVHKSRLENHENTLHNHCCDMCDKSFPNALRLVKHTALLHKEQEYAEKEKLTGETPRKIQTRFWCKYCKQVFPVRRFLTVHLVNCHGSEMGARPTLKCKKCERQFSNRAKMYAHAAECNQMALMKGTLTCDTCEQIFYSKDKLITHMAKHYSKNSSYWTKKVDSTYVCRMCGHQCTTAYGIYAHQRKYHGRPKRNDQLLKCDDCAKTFGNPISLKRHQATHKAGAKLTRQVFGCGECGEEFLRQSRLITHFKLHKKQKAIDARNAQQNTASSVAEDAEINKSQPGMSQSLGNEPSEISSINVDLSDDGPSKRRKTGNDQNSKDKLPTGCFVYERPIQKPSGEQNDTIPSNHPPEYAQRSVTQGAEKNYVCTKCNKTWKTFRGFHQHQRQVHARKLASNELPCDVCDKRFITIEQLTEHKRKHLQVPKAKTFICGECGAESVSKMRMLEHFSVHTRGLSLRLLGKRVN